MTSTPVQQPQQLRRRATASARAPAGVHCCVAASAHRRRRMLLPQVNATAPSRDLAALVKAQTPGCAVLASRHAQYPRRAASPRCTASCVVITAFITPVQRAAASVSRAQQPFQQGSSKKLKSPLHADARLSDARVVQPKCGKVMHAQAGRPHVRCARRAVRGRPPARSAISRRFLCRVPAGGTPAQEAPQEALGGRALPEMFPAGNRRTGTGDPRQRRACPRRSPARQAASGNARRGGAGGRGARARRAGPPSFLWRFLPP